MFTLLYTLMMAGLAALLVALILTSPGFAILAGTAVAAAVIWRTGLKACDGRER